MKRLDEVRFEISENIPEPMSDPDHYTLSVLSLAVNCLFWGENTFVRVEGENMLRKLEG